MTTIHKESIIKMAHIFALHYLPKHLKVELWRIYKDEQKEKLPASHKINVAFKNSLQACEVTAQDLQYLGNAFYKIKPTKQRSKRPRQWVNKFYSRQA